MAQLLQFGDFPDEEQAELQKLESEQASQGGSSQYATPPSQMLPDTKFVRPTPEVLQLSRAAAIAACKECEVGYGKGANKVRAAQLLPETDCIISSKKGNKGKGENRYGYPKRKVGLSAEHYWHHIGYLAGDDFELLGRATVVQKLKQGYEFSHLCHQPRCFKPEHIVLEQATDNASRSACKGVTWVKCPGDSIMFNPCPHIPQCILPMDPNEWGWTSQ